MTKFTVCLLLLTNLYSHEIKKGANGGFTFPYWNDMNLLNKSTIESVYHRAYVYIYVNDIEKK